MRLKAYYAWPRGYDTTEGVDVVFANNVREARKIAYKKGGLVRWSVESFIDVRVRRQPDIDWWAKLAGKPGVWEEFFWNDPCFMREAFFDLQYPTCMSCGKSDFSKLHEDPAARCLLHERWKVCSECGFCAECGHEERCSRRES